MDSSTSRSRGCSGQNLIMVTLLLIPMFAMVGLVTDIGYIRFLKMSAQTAAEAAAQAAIVDFRTTVGGSNFSCGGSVVCAPSPTDCPADIVTPANPIEHGCMYAQQHGFKSAGNQQVTYQSGVSDTPPTAPGTGKSAYWVTFRAMQRVPLMFMAVLGDTSGLVAARSTAAIMGGSHCIYALNPTIESAILVGGSSSLISSCGIQVNSSHSCALATNGNSVTLSAPGYDVVGGACTQNLLTPPPNTGVPPASDPLAALPAPAAPPYHCDHWNLNLPNQQAVTLQPGVYCGGIHVQNNDVTFAPGTYILAGGGLSTQSANSHIYGEGIMFYNTFGLTDHGGQSVPYAPIDINATSTVSLKASNTGTYAGILFFEDRAAPPSADSYGGGSSAVYQGVIYAKNAAITMYGNSSANNAFTLLVADTINVIGTSAFNNDYSALPNGSPIQQIAIVE